MENIKTALKNWHRMIVIQPDADLRDPAVKQNIANIDAQADKALAAFRRDAKDSLFLGRAPVTSADMTSEYAYIWNVAKAYGSYGSKYYNKEEILEILLFCLEYMNQNRYGQKEIDGVGWRDMRQFNWHDWDLGSPEKLINTLIVLGDKVSLDDRKRYLKAFDFRVPVPRDYASNKVHFEKCCIGSGLLQENEDKIYAAINACADTNIYVDGWKNDGQGFYTDGSYIFHTRHPMNATYGIIHAICVVEICKIFKETKFADPELEKRVCEWAENAFAPFLSKTLVCRRVIGRHPDHGTRAGGHKVLGYLCEVASLTDDPYYKNLLLQAVKRNITANPEMIAGSKALVNFYAGLSSDAEALVKKTVEDDSFELCEYNLNKVYHNEDIVMHHNKGVAYALAMSSSRIYNYECINHQNQDGWYIGDGMLTAFADDFYAYYDGIQSDNPYRKPGTTVDDREREFLSIAQGNEYLSSQDFVGGVSDGVSGAAAMRLEGYHGTGDLVYVRHYKPTGEYGDAPEKRDATLLAKKAYFFNGTRAICLGADISAHDNSNVLTVIDNRKTAKDIKPIGGEKIDVTEKDTFVEKGVRGLFLDGFGGYYFPEDMDVTVCKGGKNKDYLEIVAHHGKDPIDASYSYQILPRMSESELENYVKDPDFKILANDKYTQAVEYKDGKKMYVFWVPRNFDGIRVSAPCMVMIANGKFYVSDPTHRIPKVTITVGGKFYVFDLKDKYGATVVKNI